MNFIRKKRVNWIVAMAMLALPGTLMTSCSKETNPTEVVEPKGDKLVISVKGANIQRSVAPLKQGVASKAKASTTTAAHKVYEFADVDMAVSVGNNLPVKTISMATGGKRSGLAADASTQAVEAIEAGVKYAVYIYEGSNFVSSAVLEAGTAGTIEGLNPEGSYTWVALSYSDLEDAPAETPSSVDVVLPENKDVLHASGTINLAESNTIDITFDHVYSRVGIELNTIGVFGEITGTPAVSVSGLSLAAGSLNLLDGTLTASSETFEPTLTYADFVNVDEAYDDAMIAYLYTAPVPEQTATLTIQNLSILHADNAGGDVSRTFFTTAANFPLQVTPVAAQSHHFLLNVVESALTTNYDDHEVKWGRSNLYYTFDEEASRQYRFFAKNELSNRANGYFAFGSAVPFRFPASSDDFADPCALVYPQGLWRQPTNDDFAGLVSGQIELTELTDELGPLGEVVNATGLGDLVNLITNLLGNAVVSLINVEAPNSELGPNPYEYAQYDLAGGPSTSDAFDENSNHLRFYYNGQILDATVLQDIAEGEGLLGAELNELSVDLVGSQLLGLNVPLLETYETATALWTSEHGADILGLAGLGSWGYFGSTGRGGLSIAGCGFLGLEPCAGDRFVMGQRTGEALNNISAVGVNVLSTSMKNVRCVRD